MEVRNVRWVGIPTRNYDAMVAFLSSVMGLRVNFDDSTTIELSTSEGDEVQVMAPGDPYFEFFARQAYGPVPLFEVADVSIARRELESAGIEVVGPGGADRTWEWIHFRAPDGNLYELASRLTGREADAGWLGVVIAESLRDPALLNELQVVGAHITRDQLPVDESGSGRWHLYWTRVPSAHVDLVGRWIKHGWYAHFWSDERLLVVYDDARFEMDRFDRSTWVTAIEHGLGQGLRREWLDFPTDDTVGDLE